jgi:hypothetical protein
MGNFKAIAQFAPVYANGTLGEAANTRIFPVDSPCVLDRVVISHATVSSAGTLEVRKVTSGQAVPSGTSVLATPYDLTGPVNVPVVVELTSDVGALHFNLGDAVAVQFISVTGGAGWNITARLRRLTKINN